MTNIKDIRKEIVKCFFIISPERRSRVELDMHGAGNQIVDRLEKLFIDNLNKESGKEGE